MTRYRKKGLAASTEVVDAAGFGGTNVQGVVLALGLPWSPGPGTHATYVNPATGEFSAAPGKVVPVGSVVVKSSDGIQVMGCPTFVANYDPVQP